LDAYTIYYLILKIIKIKIEIECDTIMQIFQHQRVINHQIRKEMKRQNLNQFEDDFSKKLHLEDDNCYGEHSVIIKPV
jgi:hypothetical protein